jgi:hypothetical protein
MRRLLLATFVSLNCLGAALAVAHATPPDPCRFACYDKD